MEYYCLDTPYAHNSTKTPFNINLVFRFTNGRIYFSSNNHRKLPAGLPISAQLAPTFDSVDLSDNNYRGCRYWARDSETQVLNFGSVLPIRPEIREIATFAITVDFVRSEGDPSRPFRTMIGLLDAIRRLDRDLARSIDTDIEPVLVLEDVEAGSIKSWVATILHSADDDALKSGDWKKLLGNYLVKAKYIVLKKIDGLPSITQPRLLEELQSELAQEAQRSDLGLLVGYTPLSRTQLAAHIADITTSLEPLMQGDNAFFEDVNGQPVRFNARLRVNEEELNELLATRKITNDAELILKVKKPDFLGASMWEFHFDGHTIHASFLDELWLEKFRQDGLGVRPGVALRAMVRIQASYNDENDYLPPRYTVIEVFEVIQPVIFDEQLFLLPSTYEKASETDQLQLPPPSDEPEQAG